MNTTLNCLGWMQNQKDQNPCVTAQEVGRLCNSEYTVSLTNFQESNYIPNATTSNGCTCSWSIYNLLSACSYCVGQEQYPSWSTWVTDCGSNASSTSYLPLGLTMSQGIPYWATINPTQWENGVFNVIKASDNADHPDVTGISFPTKSTVGVSVGAIVGAVIGAITILIIGGLIIFWVLRLHRRRRMHTTPTGGPSFEASQQTTMSVSSVGHRTPLQPSFGYAYPSPGPVSHLSSPVHSATSLAPTSPLASPISSGFSSHFSSHEHSTTVPVADAADMISPFLVMSSTLQKNRSNTSPLRGKAAEALSERATAPPKQRARMNPPPYSPSTEPGSSGVATSTARRVSTKRDKKKKDSVSAATMRSGHSRTSTKESATTVHASPRTEQDRLRSATVETVGSTERALSAGGMASDDGNDNREMAHSRRADERPPAV